MIVFPVTGSDSDSSSGSESDDHEEREHTPEDKDSMGVYILQWIRSFAIVRLKVLFTFEKAEDMHNEYTLYM